MNYQKIKTWEDACKVHGVNPTELPTVSNLPKKLQEWIIATYKMGVITEAINTGESGKAWTPDWSNWDQRKYTPYFEIEVTKDKPSGVGFSISGYDGWFTVTAVGSRLCFENREQVEHVQKHFKDIFIEMFLIQE